MNGPSAEQWRQASYELRQHAMKFDDLADEAEATAEAELEAERRHVVPLTELPAPIEQLVATYNAVHGPGPWDDPMYSEGYCEIGCVERLRSVKP